MEGMENEVAGLRSELRRMKKGRGKRYPAELRTRVVAWAVRQRAGGASWEEIKRELGQEFDTVRRWCVGSKAPMSRALVAVRVMPEPAAARLLSVVSPSGFRVDGLSPSEAAALLRELG